MGKDSVSSFFTGFLLGVVVGAAIGMLYAPAPGKETRQMVKEEAQKIKTKATEVAEEEAKKIKSKAAEVAQEVRGKTS
jgi:gas vesicle protein